MGGYVSSLTQKPRILHFDVKGFGVALPAVITVIPKQLVSYNSLARTHCVRHIEDGLMS